MIKAPASPCCGVCELDRAQVCIGCGRSAGEIAEWPTADTLRQYEILSLAQQRLNSPGDRDEPRAFQAQ